MEAEQTLKFRSNGSTYDDANQTRSPCTHREENDHRTAHYSKPSPAREQTLFEPTGHLARNEREAYQRRNPLPANNGQAFLAPPRAESPPPSDRQSTRLNS